MTTTAKKTTFMHSAMKKILAFFGLLLFLIPSAFSHSVQVAYCVSCNGDLRIFVEHWHSTENPAGTNMTITLTVNGVPSTQTQSPVTGIVDIPFGSLPGCVTPVTVAAQCPGQANLYNDWVIYDYTGLPSGVPISFTIVSGNTVFTQDGCGMYPLTVNFTIPGTTTGGSPVTGCVGQPLPDITFGAGTTWTNDNTGIGLPASGSGNITGFTPTAPGVANISYTSGCESGTFPITIDAGSSASFTESTNGNPVCLGTTVNFTSTSSGASSWQWDFGDGNTSTLENPSHTYAAPGTYIVSLLVPNNMGCDGYASDTVIIAPFPVPSFTTTPGCPGSNSTANNTSTIASGTMSYQWTMNGAVPGTSIAQNPSFQYATGGTYSIQLIATSDVGCVDSITQNIVIPYMPNPEFTFTNECVGTANSFTDQSTVTNGTITQWNWDFGDGTPAGNTQNPTHVYATTGTFNVTLTPITNDGCLGPTITHQVTVTPMPTATFNVTNACVGQQVNANNTSSTGFTYDWDFGNGDTDTAYNATSTYAAAGNYTVTLIIMSGVACGDTATQTVTVYDTPVADFTFINQCLGTAIPFTDQSTVLSGTIAQWDWDFGDGSGTSALQNPSYSYTPDGSNDVTLTVTSSNGCVDSVTQSVTTYPIPAAAFVMTSVCEGAVTGYTNQSTVSSGTIAINDWDFGDGTNSALANPTHIYPGDGTFSVTLTVTSSNGCVDSTTQNATVYPEATVNFSADVTQSCSPLCFNLTDNSFVAGGTINQTIWVLSTGENSSSANPNFCIYNTSQVPLLIDVTLTVTTNNGCVSDSTINDMLSVFPIPIASFSADPQPTTIWQPELTFTDLSVSSIDTWSWDLGDGTLDTASNPVHEYAVPGTYDVYLLVENIYGCTDDTLVPVVIDPLFIMYVPNTFTPNSDGINEVFIPMFEDYSIDPTQYEFMIFNRWGELVFQTDNVDKGWDGTYRGMISKQDTYVWKIKVKDMVSGKKEVFYGHVNLLK